jgi:hypothetical protein
MRLSGPALLLLMTGASAVHSQSVSTRAAQTPVGVQSPAAARTPVKPTTTVSPPSAYRAASQQVIPANLFGFEDRAIIIVGGKPVAAGDLKRSLVNELRREAVTGPVIRGPSRPQPMSVRDLTGNALPVPGGFKRPVNPNTVRESITVAEAQRRAAIGNGSKTIAARSPALSYAEARDYCLKHPPEISRVRGAVTPNGRFTIEGLCFGSQTGAVDAIGQFPGGNMRLVFESWSDVEIKAFVPTVSGVPDHTVALTVVRFDKARSPAAQATFFATRAIVPVPDRYWTPDGDFFQMDIDQGGGNIFSGYKSWGAGAASRSTPFMLTVNPACALDGASWSVSQGRIEAFNGWENGPPHQANVEVVWTPRCTTHTTNYVFASSSQRICSVGFKLSATASCPVGIAP